MVHYYSHSSTLLNHSADINLQAIQVRHGDIDDGNIRCCFPDQPNGFPAVGRFCNHLHIAALFNDTAKPGPDNTMVICQKDFDQICSPSFDFQKLIGFTRS